MNAKIRTVLVATAHLHDPEAEQLVRNLVEGDAIELRREADNPVDPERAVACWFRGRKIGYLPSRSSFPRSVLENGLPCRCLVADAALTQGNMIREVPRLWIEWGEEE